MGKPAASCFKILACGSDSVDREDLQAPKFQSKSPSDRRGWSFRKRSVRHRVLSNTASSEVPLSVNKETPESTTVNFQVQHGLDVSDKEPVVQLTEEKSGLSTQPESNLSDITLASKDDSVPDGATDEASIIAELTEEKSGLSTQPESNLSDITLASKDDLGPDGATDEASIIAVQAGIRALPAQKVLVEQKNIIKLQAAVRGHLVRRHAVGSLRCVQSIIRIQSLVRGRRARLLLKDSGNVVKQIETGEKDQRKEPKPKDRYTYVSIETLLSNSFAHQLVESTPRTKSINIKCESLKSDDSWKWFERWMSVLTVSNKEQQEADAVESDNENSWHSDAKEDTVTVSDDHSESAEVKPGRTASAEAPEEEGIPIIYDVKDLDLHRSQELSSLPSHHEIHNTDLPNSRSHVTESTRDEIKETDFIDKDEAKSLSKNEETGDGRQMPETRIISTEQPGTEVKRLSRKASNPAFIAAQSKFEDLSSTVPPAKQTTSSSHDSDTKFSLDKPSSATDEPIKSRDIRFANSAIPNASAIRIEGSEGDTELSISSTLDSPDGSEGGNNDIEQGMKDPSETDHFRREQSLVNKAYGNLIRPDTNILQRDENLQSGTWESLNPAIGSPQLEKTADRNGLHLELGSDAAQRMNKSSPDASPKSHTSHVTFPESQATPSSQVSVKPKKTRSEKGESHRKSIPSLGDKRSHSNMNQDLVSKSSMEPSQEHKSGRRRSSVGSAKVDHREQEPRDSSSNTSLPSYMLATESARAKAIANGSPRSSPDVHDKDIYIKKRHSLPGSSERQGSPRIQRSLSQAQQNAKGNGTQSPQDRKWRR